MGWGIKAVHVVPNLLREFLHKMIILQREADNLLKTSASGLH
jgi:hypothetical protein